MTSPTSYVTVTDQFCGAGGSSLGAVAAGADARRRVFCASLADVFEGPETMPANAVGAVRGARLRLFALIEQTPWLDWLLLTKRPENIMGSVPHWWAEDGFPLNVWIGTSVENQKAADERIPHLLGTPARVRFLSCEPLLGPVNLERAGAVEAPGPAWSGPNALIDWVIVGGESGGSARPMHPLWARSLRDQCEAAGIAFHFKQWGEHVGGIGDPRMYISLQNGREMAGGVTTHSWGEGYVSERVGKHAAGRLLDDRTWDEFPVDD